MARPTTVLKALSIFLAAFLAVAISLGVWVRSRRDRGWAALESRVAELTPTAGAPPMSRVPLGRTLLPGNAWDDYLRTGTAQISKHLPSNLASLLEDGSPEERKSLIDQNAAAIELVRSGVRRETARPPVPEQPPGHNPILGSIRLPLRELALVTVARARREADSGNLREALELLLDVNLLCRDVAGTRGMKMWEWGLQPMETALKEIEQLSRKLDPAMLPDLERRLAVLDEYFPDTRGELLDRLLHLGELLIQEDESDSVLLQVEGERVRRHWRTFYSTRLEAASTFTAGDAFLRQALALKDVPRAAAEPEIQALTTRLEALHDPVLNYFLDPLDNFAPAAPELICEWSGWPCTIGRPGS